MLQKVKTMQTKNIKFSRLKKIDLTPSEVEISNIDSLNFVRYSGYASVFDVVDAYGDIVRQGAFKTSLNKRNPIILYQHSTTDPIGRVWKCYEDRHGLYVEFDILKTLPLGDVAIKLLDTEIINGLSIGYNIVRSTELADGGQELQELDLYEISIVTFPANELSRVKPIIGNDELEEKINVEKIENDLINIDFLNDLKKFNVHFAKGV